MLAGALGTNRAASILIGSLVVTLLAAFAVMLFRHASQVRVATEARIAEEIAQEDRTFCGSFGIGSEGARHAECAKGLMEIRKRQQGRIASDLIGGAL